MKDALGVLRVLLVLVPAGVAPVLADGAVQIPASCATSWESPDLQAVAFAPDGSIFSANLYTSLVFHYSADGSSLGSWSLPTGPMGHMFGPFGIDVDAQSNVYASDYFNRCVMKCSSNGAVLDTIGYGVLVAPRGVACDRQSGHFYVCDGPGYAIREFDSAGELVRSITADFYTSDVALGSAGELYACAYNGRMYRYSADGTLITTWQPADAGPSTIFYSVARGPDGRIHVVDRGGRRVIVLTGDLQKIGEWSLDCAGFNFQCPDGLGYNSPVLTGIDVNEQGGAVLGSDCMPNQVGLFAEVTVATRNTTWGALKLQYR